MTPNPKPTRRIRASQAEWSDLHELFQHATCVACGMAPVELHHAVPRSQGGDDIALNLVPLCRQHHMMLEAHENGWERIAAHVRAYIWGRIDRRDYVLGKLGQDRFDRRYPLPPWTAIGGLDRYRTPDSWLREPKEEI